MHLPHKWSDIEGERQVPSAQLVHLRQNNPKLEGWVSARVGLRSKGEREKDEPEEEAMKVHQVAPPPAPLGFAVHVQTPGV